MMALATLRWARGRLAHARALPPLEHADIRDTLPESATREAFSRAFIFALAFCPSYGIYFSFSRAAFYVTAVALFYASSRRA